MPTTPSTPQHIDSYSIISISGHRLTSPSGKWGKKGKSAAKPKSAGAASGSEGAKPAEKSGGLGGLLKGLGSKLKGVVQPTEEKQDP